MDKTWVLVADGGRARLFELADFSDEDMVEVKAWANPEGRMAGRDLQANRPGRTHDIAGSHRHAMEPEVTPREKSNERFAHDLTDELERGRVEHRYDRLVLVAPPSFLGTLNGKLGKQVSERVAMRIDKDLTVLSPGEIRDHLPARLPH